MRREVEITHDIVEHPERDDLRLEFADAIEARDPAWAAFIRDCLDPSGRDDGNPFFQPGPKLEARLEVPFRRLGDVGITFHRGFPTTAYMPVETFLTHGDEILSLAPILEVVLRLPYRDDRGLIPFWNPRMPALAACPALARVRELTFGSGWFDLDSVKYLIGSPYIENLLRLTGGDWRFDSDAVREQQEDEMWPLLLESPVFRRMLT